MGADVLDEIETWSAERVAALESERLAAQLAYVAGASEFYRRQWAAAGVDSAQVRSVADLHRLPFTEKQELRDSLSEEPPLGRHLAASRTSLTQVQATSGTTGTPSFFGLTEHDLHVWGQIGARAFFASGFRPGDVILHGWGLSKGFAGGVPAVRILQQLGCCVLPIGGEAGAERLLTIAELMQPRGFCTGPNFAIHAGQAAQEVLGRAASTLGVEHVVVGGEPGGGIPTVRDRIESLWGATCCEMLGNSDVAPIVFAECPERQGMHVCSQGLVHVELVDPASGAAVPWETGATGEVVLTALDRQASPLVRFRTRDHVEVLGTDCACGRTSPRIRCFGRTDDMLIVRGINVWPSAVRELVIGFQPLATGNVRIVADFPGHSTERRLKVRVEHAPDLGAHQLAGLADDLSRRITQVLAFRPDLELVPPGVLPEAGVNKTMLVDRP
ncbi:MAG: phenylacetate--CoA ligase [Blastococcus sp.]|nr:phenylacetate--CoA ligase [Blastococcus sp.]